jgi:Helix-turn-helix domain
VANYVGKGSICKFMFVAKNMKELRRLYDSDTPVLAYAFKRRTVEGWTPEHSHLRGQLIALTQGVLIVEVGSERQARLFAALEMLAQRKSVTEVAIAIGYDSVSAFIEMFRTMMGTTPQTYFRGGRSSPRGRAMGATARLPDAVATR